MRGSIYVFLSVFVVCVCEGGGAILNHRIETNTKH